MNSDQIQRFVFDDTDIRGAIVQLDRSFFELLGRHEYPAPVAGLLGEALAAACLMSTSLKFDGVLSLQARGDRGLRLLQAECAQSFDVRGIARYDSDAVAELDAASFRQLLGDGVMALTLEPATGRPYQGIVPLAGDSLAECLACYFEQSEQLATRFWLFTQGERCAGMLLQQLPAQLVRDADERDEQWQHLLHLASTITGQELLTLPATTILQRLFNQEAVRVFDPASIRFRCGCSHERIMRALAMLPRDDIQSMLDDDGEARITCEFCHAAYVVSGDELQALLQDAGAHRLH
jgi:molecular chaperone Hsp33